MQRLNYYCGSCGEELTDKNSVGTACTCLPCQSKRFKQLEQRNGTHMALFLCCAAFDIPCEPMIAPVTLVNYESDKWEHYLTLLDEAGKLIQNDEYRRFEDGESDIRKIFGKTITETTFAWYVSEEQKRMERLPGTEAQRERWGVRDLWRGVPMNDDIYKELDHVYTVARKSYNGMNLSEQQENTLIYVTKMRVAASTLMSAGNADFTKLLKSADDMLGSEQMRRKDEKPMEDMRISGLVSALENNGLMKEGEFLTQDETARALCGLLKKQKYDYSLDVADQVIFSILNAMRQNADMELLTDLPEELLVEDTHGEFLEEETEKEKESKKYAGLMNIAK